MTYTTQQLQGMSDHTVNHALYHKLFQVGVNVPDVTPDYCNNYNDIMPLAFECGIYIFPSNDGSLWSAYYWDPSIDDGADDESSFSDTNPLRAIACLLLMMED